MAALCTGNYGMSQNCTDDSKEYFFVKLTDSAYRAVEEYQRNQSKYSTHATIEIIKNGGILSFPTNGGNVEQKFSFSIDDIEGSSFECIRQTQNQLDVLGALAYKMRIHAKDDVYEATRHRMAVAEENQKNKCTREIKPNQTDIGRKVKLKSTGNRLPNIPPKRDLQQNPTTSQSPLSSSLHNTSSPSSNSLLLNGGSVNSSLSPKNNNGIISSSSSSLSSSSATSLSLSSSNNISNNNIRSNNNNINISNNNNNNNNNYNNINNNNGLSTIGAASSLPSSSSPSIGSLKSSSNINNNMSTTSSSVTANSLNINNNSSMNYNNSNNNINSSNSSNNISTKLQHQSSYSNSIAGLTTGLSSASSLSSVLSSAAGSGTSGINSGYCSNNGRIGSSNSSLNGAGSRRGATGVSGSASRNQKPGDRHMPDIKKKKIRERLIHLLALKPFKKPELYSRLQNEGIRDREKSLISGILKEISTMKDNTYNLKRQIWNDVNEDWPFYTEQELQMLKRRKPQNLTPPLSSDGGSSTSGQSPTSTHNGSPPPAVKRPSLDRDRYYEEPISKKQRISHFRKDTNDITSSSLPSKRHHDAEESHIGLTYSVLGNEAARHISPRDDFLNGHFTSSHNYTSSNNNNSNNNNNNNNTKNSLSSSNSNNLRQQSPSNYYNNNTSNNNKTNFVSESRRQTSSPVIVGNNSSSNQLPSSTGDRRRNYNSNSNSNNLSSVTDIVGNSDGGKQENPGHLNSNSGIADSSSAYKNNNNNININNNNNVNANNNNNNNNNINNNNESSGNNNSNSKATNQTTGGPFMHKTYDFSKFTKITSIEQRRLYKTEFEKDYDEYRELFNKIENVSKRFKLLAQKLDNEKHNESNYRVIKKQIFAEYDKINREQEHQRTKARFDYLHAKLAHIKALINEFDQTLISSSSTNSSNTNSSSQGNPSDQSSGNYGRNSRMLSSNSPLQNFNPSNGNANSSTNYRNLSPNLNNNGNLGSQEGSPNLLQHHLPKLENY